MITKKSILPTMPLSLSEKINSPSFSFFYIDHILFSTLGNFFAYINQT